MKDGMKKLVSFIVVGLSFCPLLPSCGGHVDPMIDDANSGIGLYVITKADKYGYCDSTGHLVIPCQYDYAFPFQEGRALINIKEGDRDHYGFIDQAGDIVIPAVYDNAHSFSEGFAAVGMGDEQGRNIERWGFVDMLGNVAIPLKFRGVGSFHEGVSDFTDTFKSTNQGYDMGFIDKSGAVVIPANFSMYSGTGFNEGLCAVRKWFGSEERWGAIDKKGTLVVDFISKSPFQWNDGLALVWDGHSFGWVDETGKMIVGPFSDFEDAKPFSQGLAAFVKNGKWGFLNKTGKVVIDPVYEYANSFSEGLAAVKLEGRYGFVGTDGHMVIQPSFGGVHLMNDGFVGGVCRMSSTDNDVLINATGKVIYTFD